MVGQIRSGTTCAIPALGLHAKLVIVHICTHFCFSYGLSTRFANHAYLSLNWDIVA